MATCSSNKSRPILGPQTVTRNPETFQRLLVWEGGKCELPPGAWIPCRCCLVNRPVFGWHSFFGLPLCRKMNGWKWPKSTQVKKGTSSEPNSIIFFRFLRPLIFQIVHFFFSAMNGPFVRDRLFWKNKRRRRSLFAIIIWLKADWGNHYHLAHPNAGHEEPSWS